MNSKEKISEILVFIHMNKGSFPSLTDYLKELTEIANQEGYTRGFEDGLESAKTTVNDWYEPEAPDRDEDY